MKHCKNLQAIFNIWDKYGDTEAMNIILRGDIEKLVAVELVSEEDATNTSRRLQKIH